MNKAILAGVLESHTGRMVCTSELAEEARNLGADFHESWLIADFATGILCDEIETMLESEAS